MLAQPDTATQFPDHSSVGGLENASMLDLMSMSQPPHIAAELERDAGIATKGLE